MYGYKNWLLIQLKTSQEQNFATCDIYKLATPCIYGRMGEEVNHRITEAKKAWEL